MREIEKDFGSLYEEATLAYWQTRYSENVHWNFSNLLLQRLMPEEHHMLRDVQLQFPLVGAEEMRSFPLAFYSYHDPPTVTLPILSIKFLDDLSIASAWLELSGFSQETIMDYIAMLKYANPRRFVSQRFPPPLLALQIPNKVLDDRQVDDLSQKILKSSLIWILAHELGHIRFRHEGYAGISAKQAQQNEMAADQFATELFRRIGTVPAGMALLFLVFAHLQPNRGDFSSDTRWREYLTNQTTHPISSTRLKGLQDELSSTPDGFAAAEPNKASALRSVREIARRVREISELLEDTGLQRLMRARGLTVTPESLAPRRLGEVFVSAVNRVRSTPRDLAFHGIYSGVHKRKLAKGGTESLDCCTLLERNGEVVIGRFNFGVGEGAMNGRIVRESLFFDWEWGNVNGKGVLKPASDTKFSGHWGHDESRDNGGTWTGSLNR